MQKYFDINKENHSIKCKLYSNDPRSIKNFVLFGTGFAGHKDNRAAERFAESYMSKYKNSAIMTFNWPCHGDDVKKKLSLDDCQTYIRLVLEYIKESYDPQKLFLYATSLGGFLFLKYISENGNPFRKIALRCPAINIYEILSERAFKADTDGRLQKGKDVMIGFDRKIAVTLSFLEDLKASDLRAAEFIDYADDILIIHGTKDEVVPIDEVRRFAEDNVIEFIPVEKADHRFQDFALMGAAINAIIEFFKS